MPPTTTKPTRRRALAALALRALIPVAVRAAVRRAARRRGSRLFLGVDIARDEPSMTVFRRYRDGSMEVQRRIRDGQELHDDVERQARAWAERGVCG